MVLWKVALPKIPVLVLALTGCVRAFSSVREPTPFPRHSPDLKPLTAPDPPLQRTSALFVIQSTSKDEVERGNLPANTIHDNDETVTSSGGKNGTRTVLVSTFISALAAASLAAKSGIIKGPFNIATGDFGVYSDAFILRDIGSSLAAAALAYVLVKLISTGYQQSLYSSKVSRKLSHTLSAPLYMLVYPIFSPADGARYFALCVAFLNALRLYLAGTGWESTLAASVSRSGDKSEALGGPFIYVCFFQLFILLYWRVNPIGIVAMSTMAAGDGMADLIGRRWGSTNKWWFSESKSVVGTVAFAVSSALTSFGLLSWLSFTGCMDITMNAADLAIRVAAISIICAIVELVEIGDDNYSVPISAAVLTALLIR